MPVRVRSNSLSKKNNVGWFPITFVDLFRVCLVKTIPTRFRWLTRRKQKNVQSTILQQGQLILVFTLWLKTGFCPLFNVYFNGVQRNRWLYLSSILWGIPLCCDLFRKRIDQKNLLLQQRITKFCYLFDGL